MARPEPQLRKLDFQTFDDLLSEADRLLQQGYVSRGNWTLGQTCMHLSDWMRFPIDGFPKPPIWMRPIFWIMKMTVAKSMSRKILANGFKPGIPTDPRTVPDAEAQSDAEGVAKLHATVQRLQDHNGPLHASPLFGEMDKETLCRVSLLHGELHLGFLEPK